MALDIFLLLVALLAILGSAELFTNGVEWLGHKLSLSEGVIGSIFASVGTAMPETILPIVAILFFHQGRGHEIGVGAVAGAPFMLSTLTLALCGLSVVYYAQRGRRKFTLNLDSAVISRDLSFFIVAYTAAILASLFVLPQVLKWLFAFALLSIYPIYVYRTFKHKGEVGLPPEHLHFGRLFKHSSKPLKLIIMQTAVGVCGIVSGSMLFVDHVQSMAAYLSISPLILSLVISPIATELPEKVNSILWARNGKDTLAVGNVTGSLVFQSCFPVAFAVAFTAWHLPPAVVASGFVAISCAIIYLVLLKTNKLTAFHLLAGAVAYASTIVFLITSH